MWERIKKFCTSNVFERTFWTAVEIGVAYLGARAWDPAVGAALGVGLAVIKAKAQEHLQAR